jgi:hypothetical protein
MAGSVMLVLKGTDAVVRRLVEHARQMRPGKDLGPVISAQAKQRSRAISRRRWTPAPKRRELGAEASKEQLIARLRETFRFCETALSKVNDSRLGGMVPYFGSGEVSQAANRSGR